MKRTALLKKLLAEANVKPKHGTPMTRRDLFAQGYMSYGAYIALPSIMASVSREAYGQDCATNTGADDGPALVIIDMAGGINLPGRNFVVGGEGGSMDFLPVNASGNSYASIGVRPEGAPQIVAPDMTFGLPLNPSGQFSQVLAAMTSDATKARVDGSVIAAISNDDTGNNPLNPAYLVAQATRGEVVTIVGTEGTASGGNSMTPETGRDPSLRPVQIRSPIDAVNLVLPGRLTDILGRSGLQKVMRAAQNMSSSQLAKFQNKSFDEQMKGIIGCAMNGAEAQLMNFRTEDVDPALDPVIQELFLDEGSGRMRELGSVVKLALDGYSKVAVATLGGCDYHNDGEVDTTNKDMEAAQMFAAVMEAAVRKQKDVMVVGITDGGTASDESAMNEAQNYAGFLPSSDNGNRSLIPMFFVKGSGDAGRMEIRDGNRQIGHFRPNGSIASDANRASDNPAIAAKAIAANWFAMAGRETEIEKFIGERIEPELLAATDIKKS